MIAEGPFSEVRPVVLVIVPIMILAFVFFGSKPVPDDLTNSSAYGCYTNAQAPSILLDIEGMKILQNSFPQIDFHLERHKTGIALVADRPIRADPVMGRYEYGIERRGVGWFLNFYNEINGRRYGVFDKAALYRFTMLAQDGVELAYEKSPGAQCA